MGPEAPDPHYLENDLLLLTTGRLNLRYVHHSDAADLSRSMTPAVSQWLISWPYPFTLSMAAERIDTARSALASGDMLPLIIERHADHAFLGWVSVTRIAERRGLLSYWLGEDHHRHGYMREAVTIALAKAFGLLDLDVIEAAAQVQNEPSLALLRGLGMETLGEEMMFAPARDQDELCAILELKRSSANNTR